MGGLGKEGLEEGRAEGERASEIVLYVVWWWYSLWCGRWWCGGCRFSREPKKVYFMYLASTASRLPLSVL